jgi:hypothetical protein
MHSIGRSFPNAEFQDFHEAFDYLNRAHWNLSVTEHDGKRELWAGDQHMLSSSTPEELEAFVLGMAVTFSMVGPDELPGFEPWKSPTST